jgi:exopolyphosphatase/pppGpp-phosphohydrolase
MNGISRGLFATDCEVAAARWVQRKLGDCQHERRVLAIAAKLFDLTRPVLGLGLAECRLLRLAALTHDVGRSVSEKDHPIEGAKMLLANYHRGRVPEAMDESFLRPLDPRRPLRQVLGLLRVADALDSRAIVSPELLFSIHRNRLSVRCFVEESSLREARKVYRRRKKFELLETFLGTEMQVSVEPTASYAMAS